MSVVRLPFLSVMVIVLVKPVRVLIDRSVAVILNSIYSLINRMFDCRNGHIRIADQV